MRPQQHHPHIAGWLQQAHLFELDITPLGNINHELISAFVERWHSETSSFHMPWGEMTVTLDDVSALLHLPLTGTPLAHRPHFDTADAIRAGVDLLGIDHTACWAECQFNRGPAFRFSFLMAAYTQNMERGHLDQAARCYLLHLLGSTIFADKSHTSVPVKWVTLISDFDLCGQWAWGPAALAILYEQLNDACYWETSQIGGYASLLQVTN